MINRALRLTASYLCTADLRSKHSLTGQPIQHPSVSNKLLCPAKLPPCMPQGTKIPAAADNFSLFTSVRTPWIGDSHLGKVRKKQ
jgi:hypothetical protein